MTMFPNMFPNNNRVPLNPDSSEPNFINELAKLSPETIGNILSNIPNSDYDKYYGDYTTATQITPIPRVRGVDTYTPVSPRTTPVGFQASLVASLQSGITERLFSIIDNKLVSDTNDVVDNNSFFRAIENKLKSTEEGRYIWYSRFLNGAYDKYNNSGSLLSSIANDTARYKYLKTLSAGETLGETLGSFTGGLLDPVTLGAGIATGGIAGAGIRAVGFTGIGSGLLATETGALGFGLTREAILQYDDPTRTALDSTEAIGYDLLVGAALHGTIKTVGFTLSKFSGKPISIEAPVGETVDTAGKTSVAPKTILETSVEKNKAAKAFKSPTDINTSKNLYETIRKQRADDAQSIRDSLDNLIKKSQDKANIDNDISNLLEKAKNKASLEFQINNLVNDLKAGSNIDEQLNNLIAELNRTNPIDDALDTLISELNSPVKSLDNILVDINKDLGERSPITNFVSDNIKRGPDSPIPKVETTIEYSTNRDFFAQQHANLENATITNADSISLVGLDSSKPVKVNDWLARRTTMLQKELLENAVIDGSIPDMNNIFDAARRQSIIELYSIRDNIRFSDGSKVIRVTDSPEGFRIVTEDSIINTPKEPAVRVTDTKINESGAQVSAQAKPNIFGMEYLNEKVFVDIPGPNGKTIKIEVSGVNPSNREAVRRLFLSREETNAIVGDIFDKLSTKIEDIKTNINTKIDDIKTNEESFTNLLKDNILGSNRLSLKKSIEDSFESFIHSRFAKYGVLENNEGLSLRIREWMGTSKRQQFQKDYDSGNPFVTSKMIAEASAERTPLEPRLARARASKWIANTILGFTSGTIGTASTVTIYKLISGDFSFGGDSSVDIETLLNIEIIRSPEVFLAMYEGIYSLPDSQQKTLLLQNADKAIKEGLSPEYAGSWSMQAALLLRENIIEQTANSLGIQPLTDEIIKSTVIAYSSLKKPFSKAAINVDNISQSDKESISLAIYNAEKAILASNIEDPREAMATFGKLVAIGTDSRFWDISFPDINAYFRNMNKQSVQGINGLGSDNVSKLNVSVVASLYQRLLNTNDRNVNEEFIINAILEGSTRSLYNNSIIKKLDKMTSNNPIDTPIYAPEDGDTLYSFYKLQSKLSGNFDNDKTKGALYSLSSGDMIALKKIKQSLEYNRPFINSKDYKDFDTIRIMKNSQKKLNESNNINISNTNNILTPTEKTQPEKILKEKR